MIRRFSIAALLFLTTSAFGAEPTPAYQPPDVAEQKEKIGALSFLAGEWTGPGWIMTGPNQKREFVQTEEARAMLGDLVFTFHGTAHAPDAVGAPPAFEAFAIISWEDKADKYQMRSYTGGHVGDYEAEIAGDGVFVWRLPNMEYRITINGDSWTETGHRTLADGKKVQFFEMNLRRKR